MKRYTYIKNDMICKGYVLLHTYLVLGILLNIWQARVDPLLAELKNKTMSTSI